jgi:hypothetical protein
MDRVQKAIRTLASELRSAEDRLADDEHELAKWGFAKTPSEIRRLEERIEYDRARLAVCQRAAAVLEEPA